MLAQNITLALDCHSRPWGEYRIDDLTVYQAQNGHAWRAGIELGGRIQWRAGYAFDILPINKYLDDRRFNITRIHCFSAGLGINKSALKIDLGIMYQGYHLIGRHDRYRFVRKELTGMVQLIYQKE